MKTIFKNSKNQNVMGFSHEGLQGGFYLMGNPILATLNGPYPIRNLTEAEAVAKVRDITRDFLENTGKKDKCHPQRNATHTYFTQSQPYGRNQRNDNHSLQGRMLNK